MTILKKEIWKKRRWNNFWINLQLEDIDNRREGESLGVGETIMHRWSNFWINLNTKNVDNLRGGGGLREASDTGVATQRHQRSLDVNVTPLLQIGSSLYERATMAK